MIEGASLLVDLDGTLTEPAPGIIGSVRWALSEIGVAPAPDDDLRWIIGPPIRGSFARIGVAPEDIERTVSLYRERYVGGAMFDATVHHGVREALAELKRDGARLYVCTSKAHAYAGRIVAHFGFSDLFDHVYGSELDGARDDKGDLIAYILAQQGIAPERAVMIGDTPFDVLGARRNGVACVGVTWGHGEDCLAQAKPAAICAHPGDLPAAVRGILAR